MSTHDAAPVLDGERAEIVAMADEIVRMLGHVRDGFGRLDPQFVEEASRLGRQVHKQEQGVLGRLASASATARALGASVDEDVIFVPMHLERIAENVERLGAATGRVVREGTLFTDRAVGEVSGLLAVAIEILEGVRDAIRTGNLVLVRYVIDAGRSCETRVNEYAHFHEKRLIEGVCQPRASSIYLMMLDDIRGIEWHARQIADKLQRLASSDVVRPAGRHGRAIDL
jgi:Na+/phosphate symporter